MRGRRGGLGGGAGRRAAGWSCPRTPSSTSGTGPEPRQRGPTGAAARRRTARASAAEARFWAAVEGGDLQAPGRHAGGATTGSRWARCCPRWRPGGGGSEDESAVADLAVPDRLGAGARPGPAALSGSWLLWRRPGSADAGRRWPGAAAALDGRAAPGRVASRRPAAVGGPGRAGRTPQRGRSAPTARYAAGRDRVAAGAGGGPVPGFAGGARRAGRDAGAGAGARRRGDRGTAVGADQGRGGGRAGRGTLQPGAGAGLGPWPGRGA